MPSTGRLADRPPQPEQINLHRIERFCANARSIGMSTEEQPMTCLQSKNFQGARFRIDEPSVAHLPVGIYRQLPDAIEARRGWGEDLAHPIGCLAHVRSAGHRWHALAPPTCKVRDEDIIANMDLRLRKNPPPTRAALAELEWRDQAASCRRSGDAVRGSRAGRGNQLASDDLGDELVGHAQEIVVGCVSPRRIRHRAQRYHDQEHVTCRAFRPEAYRNTDRSEAQPRATPTPGLS